MLLQDTRWQSLETSLDRCGPSQLQQGCRSQGGRDRSPGLSLSLPLTSSQDGIVPSDRVAIIFKPTVRVSSLR